MGLLETQVSTDNEFAANGFTQYPFIDELGCGGERHGPRKRFICWLPHYGRLVQERFPVGWHPSGRSRCGLVFRVRMRWRQRRPLDRRLLLVIVEPILTRLEAGNDRMPCRRRMLGCVLTRRTVAASDVPTLRTPAEMKPPTFRRRQAFHTSATAGLRSLVDSALNFLHFDFSLLPRPSQNIS